jgi:hypothetical protein
MKKDESTISRAFRDSLNSLYRCEYEYITQGNIDIILVVNSLEYTTMFLKSGDEDTNIEKGQS